MNTIQKTVAFNGQEIYCFFASNKWWIAVEPVCAATEIEYGVHAAVLKITCGRNMKVIKKVVNNKGLLLELLFIPEKEFYLWLLTAFSMDASTRLLRMNCYQKVFEALNKKEKSVRATEQKNN